MDRSALKELTTTRYVANVSSNEIETIRAASLIESTNRHQDNETIENENPENIVLTDDSIPVHGCDETPKLIMKRPAMIRDEAVKVLMRVKSASADERHDYYIQRWFNTTRQSEMQLVQYIYLHPNARPFYFAMQCRMLTIQDVATLILTSLLAEPRDRGQCLSRIAVKTTTDLTFEMLVEMLDRLCEENSGMQVTDVSIVASLIERNNVTHRLKTKQYRDYARMESRLDEHGSLMTSRATLTCSIAGKRHVQTQITYYNNRPSRQNSTRLRFIDIEQQVKSICRQIVIDEDRNETVEYQVENEMLPLRLGVPVVQDLIEYLESGELQDMD